MFGINGRLIKRSIINDNNITFDEKLSDGAPSFVTSLTFYGSQVSYITIDGKLLSQNMLRDKSPKLLVCTAKLHDNSDSCHLVNLFAAQQGQHVSLMAIDDARLAIVGPRFDGEGFAINVIDLNFDVIVASANIKTISTGEAGGSKRGTEDTKVSGFAMVCHAGERLFFKHGSRVANVILSEELPLLLADFIGHDVDLDAVPSTDPPKFAKEKSNTDPSFDLPEWEIISSKEKQTSVWTLGEASQTLELYQVMPEILAKGNIAELEKVLDTFTEIPELLLLNIIELLLTRLNELKLDKLDETKQENKNEMRKRKQKTNNLLARAFNIPTTDTLMVQHLRQIKFEVAKSMLEWIVKELKQADQDRGNRRGKSVDMDQLFMWLGLILNAHYTNIILCKRDDEIKTVISDASDAIRQAIATTDTLASTLPLVKMIRDAASGNNARYSSAATLDLLNSPSPFASYGNAENMANRSYSIELVDL